MQTNVAPSLLVVLLLLLRRHRHRHRHLLFLAAACSDLTRRDLDVDRVRFISPPHAKACKRARERARLTGDRYLGSVVARGSLPRRFRICGASSHARVVRAIAYRLWKTRRVQFDTSDRGGVVMTPPATTPANYRYRVRLEERMVRTASTWEWVTRSTTWSTIYARES